MRATVILGLLVATGSSGGAAADRAPVWARAVGPMVQVFPTTQAQGSAVARLEAARGEWEPFQVLLRADTELIDVRAVASVLRGPTSLPSPQLYRVDYLDIKQPSSVEGHAGPWPDPLLPDRDGFVGEQRRAFPFTVPAGQARAIWAEVFVPRDAPPGAYRGSVRIVARGRKATTIPVELLVHRFTLPATSSLPVTFGLNIAALGKAHPGLSPAAQKALAIRYEVAALRHRISVHGGTFAPPPFSVKQGQMVLDFAPYDAEVGPFLDGKADPGGPAAGARWSAFDLRIPSKLRGTERNDYLHAMVAHLRERGWLDRVFDYTSDEPADSQLAEVRQRSLSLRKATPAVPRLVTRALDPRLLGAVDIWCPVVNYLDDKPGNSTAPGRGAYDARLRQGERLWWYQACMSHGCKIYGGDYFTGWPSYAVDAPAMAHRIFEWLTFRYRVGGELYYNMDEAYARGLDPWHDQFLFGGNGDGTLFYPGRPAVVGGTTDIPVASIRLALIREGLEDYEYLELYARAAGRKRAEALARSVAPKTYEWSHDPARLMMVRHRMAEAIDRATHPVASGQRLGITAP